MFYVYLLKSIKSQDLYVGYCANLKVRFHRHNAGKVKSTKGYLPWELIYYEAYKDKSDATKREKQLKNHAAKETLKKQIECSLKKS